MHIERPIVNRLKDLIGISMPTKSHIHLHYEHVLDAIEPIHDTMYVNDYKYSEIDMFLLPTKKIRMPFKRTFKTIC